MIVSIIIGLIIVIAEISLVSSVKFGFILRDEEELFVEKFVAFGDLPKEITETEMAQISDKLNKFYRIDRQDRQRKFGIEGIAYSGTLFEQIRLPNGNHQVALKGELSNLLASFRMTIINAAEPLEIWTRVKFYSDPIASVYGSPFKMTSRDFKVLLIKAAFDKFEIQPNQYLKEIYHPSTLPMAPEELSIVDPKEISSDDDDDSRYTVLEFFSSTGSLRYPLIDSPPKSFLRSKFISKRKKGKSGRFCCNSCLIS